MAVRGNEVLRRYLGTIGCGVALVAALAVAGSRAQAASELQAIEARPGSNDAAVEMGTLGAPDTSGVGLLTPVESGLSKTMWDGTSRETAVSLLEKVPVPTRSRALQSLGRRVLLTEADAPPAEGTSPNFLALRLKRLIALGDLESVVRISDELIVGKDTSEELEARADALLLRGADGDACLMAHQMMPFNADLYWVKLDAYCKARAGDAAGGEFDLALIQARDNDPVFFALYDRLTLPQGENVQPAPFDGSALALAFLRAAHLMPVSDDLIQDRPALLRAVALDASGASADARLGAAVDAATFGAFPIEALRAMFTLQGFPQEALNDPAQAAGPLVPARALALFYQAIARSQSPFDRIKLTSIAYRYAAQRGVAPVLIDLVGPMLEGITPDATLAPFAADMRNACIAAGAKDCAVRWAALAPAQGVATVAAVAEPIVAANAPDDGAAGLSAFETAANEGHVAEAVLRALEAFGGRTPAMAGMSVVAPVAQGFTALGLTSDAQALMAEAALPVASQP